MMSFRSVMMILALIVGSVNAQSLFSSVSSGCTAVPVDKCDAKNNCLICSDQSDYDCEKCCPNCTLVQKDGYSWCYCEKPKPPTPSNGTDTWHTYTVGDMDVLSVTGGRDQPYSKVVVLLHGGGGEGNDYVFQYQNGWLGNLTGMKYVFPTSPMNHLWYRSYKNGCGLLDDCAYNLSSIKISASRVAALLEHERVLIGGDASNIFLGGFSQGAQMTGYVALCEIDYALGGTIVMDGFPLPPLENMPGTSHTDAKRNATYYGQDMRWMIYHGDADPIFPVGLTMQTWAGIFDALEIDSTLKINHTEPGMTHTLIEKEFTQLVSFVRGNDNYIH